MKLRKKRTVLERLLSKTKIPVNKDGSYSKKQCWLWRGVINNAGYGMLKVDSEINMVTVHRIMMIEYNKQLNYGDKQLVLHSCGNKLCINPDHLKIGTNADKIQLQKKYNAFNPMFKNKDFMWRVCPHCNETTYLPHFKRLHSLCESKAKHKYLTQQIHQNLEKK